MLSMLDRWRSFSSAATDSEPLEARLNASTRVTASELIDLQRHARNIDMSRQLPARAQQLGNHQSRFRGRGMDYLESRTYQPGDDIRNMDWRVTARATHPHTKLFQEERERPVVLFIDLGPSLFFATRGALKSVISARTATLLAWAAAAQGDLIGALLFNGGHHELKPRNGHRGVLPLIHSLVEQTDPVRGLAAVPHPGGLNTALIRLRRIVRPGSLVFLISDFYGLNQDSANHLLRLRMHSDLAAIQITDPIELAPPAAGRYGITDGQHTGLLDTRSDTGRQHYRDFFLQQRETLQSTLNQSMIPLLSISTTDNVAAVLQGQLGKRTKRRIANRAVA